MKQSPEILADLSSLTRIQVETLKTHRMVENAEINMKDALKIRRNSGISRGTHYRILAQAKKNIRQSLFTVGVAVRVGCVRVEDVQKLLAMVSMMPAELDPEKLPEILELMRVLADRIVMV